jgi:serine phosphatase RsbU (regulator of sigma subunit)
MRTTTFVSQSQTRNAGGDFYDLFPVEDGRWMVVVGDVCGKGPEAASVMGIVRASPRAIALREHSPARLMSMVNDPLLGPGR